VTGAKVASTPEAGENPAEDTMADARDHAAGDDDEIEIDVSPSLHIAGHEEELLGTEDVPDTGPVLHDAAGGDARRADETAHEIEADIATRGQVDGRG